MLKKVLSLTLAAALALGLAACGSGDSGEVDSPAPSDSVVSETPSPSETPDSAVSESPAPSDEPSEAPSEEPSETPSSTPSATPTPTPAPTPSPTPAAPVSVDLSGFFDMVFTDPNNTPAVMDMGADKEALDAFYPGLSAISTNQCHVYIPMMTGVPFEMALVEAANPADVDAVKAAMQGRVSTEAANLMNYPAVQENWSVNSRIVSNGNYVLMVAYEECDAVVSAFNGLF